MPIAILILFLIYTFYVNFYLAVTLWDKSFILFVEKITATIPIIVFTLPDCFLYSLMIILPIFGFGFYFIKKKKWFDLAIVSLTPLIAFILNCVVKNIVKRPRPDFELQRLIHPDSFSYVSSHSLVTFCLWAIAVYFMNRYCEKKRIKVTFLIFSTCWILFVGFSRIALGVHNLTDVVGAYILGSVIVSYLIYLIKIHYKKLP